jgi:hypothetical protein
MRSAHADLVDRFGDRVGAALDVLSESWGSRSSRDVLVRWALLPERRRDAIASNLGAVLLAEVMLGGVGRGY